MSPLTESLIFAFATAAFCFFLMKAFFGFLVWLYPESDKTHRAQLDEFFDLLDRTSIFEVGRAVLQRFIRSIRRVITRPIRAYIAIGLISLILNVVVFVVTTTLVIDYYFFFGGGTEAVIKSLRSANLFDVIGLNFLVGLLGAVFDLLSLTVTLYLLTRASVADRTGSLVGHLGIDILVAAVSCMWAYGIFDITLRVYYQQLLPYWIDYTNGEPEMFLRETLWETLKVSPALWYAVICLGVSAALPTFVYMLALVPILLLRVAPAGVQRGISRVIYLITTDRQPVFKQLANFSSSASALVGATLGWLKAAPL